MKGMDLARVVTTARVLRLDGGQLGPRRLPVAKADPARHVVAYDFGIKRNILRMLADRGCRMTVVPADNAGRRSAGPGAGRGFPVQRPG